MQKIKSIIKGTNDSGPDDALNSTGSLATTGGTHQTTDHRSNQNVDTAPAAGNRPPGAPNGAAQEGHTGTGDRLRQAEAPANAAHQHNAREHANVAASDASHDGQTLKAVEHEHHHGHETEEVTRQRDIDRHVHHVQHHVQPVVDHHNHDTTHSHQTTAPTKIHETHSSTKEDKALFAGLGNKHKDERTDHGTTKTVVDGGERVNEHVSHHVHHVTQPVVERDVHHHHTTHTTVPVHQTTHEAPIVHQSTTHKPISLDAFTSGGGSLSSGPAHGASSAMDHGGKCEREVSGFDARGEARQHGTGGVTDAVKLPIAEAHTKH